MQEGEKLHIYDTRVNMRSVKCTLYKLHYHPKVYQPLAIFGIINNTYLLIIHKQHFLFGHNHEIGNYVLYL